MYKYYCYHALVEFISFNPTDKSNYFDERRNGFYYYCLVVVIIFANLKWVKIKILIQRNVKNSLGICPGANGKQTHSTCKLTE